MKSSSIVKAEDAWLNIDVSESEIFNPMDFVFEDLDNDKVIEKLTCLMMDPNYFAFTCKHILNVDIHPFQNVILRELWERKFPMLIGSRGMSKSFTLAVYCWLRCLLIPKRKIIIVGAAFRQSKVVFEYMEAIWRNAPVLRDLCDASSGPVRDVDRCVMRINGGSVTALPLGDGQKIRGQRANDIIADEFACLGKESLIQTDIGLVKIEDYLRNDAYSLINKDREFETPDQIFKTPKTDVYRVTTDCGYSFRCSELQKVMTIDGWKNCVELSKNDWLELDFCDYFPDVSPPNINQENALLLGILLSNSNLTSQSVISFKTGQKSIVDEFSESFTVTAQFGEQFIVKSSNTEVRQFLRYIGLDYWENTEKEIPYTILQSSKKDILSFLNGLYQNNSSVFLYKTGQIKGAGISYCSTSEILIDQLQILLLKLSIVSTKTKQGENYTLSCRNQSAKKLYDILSLVKWECPVEEFQFVHKGIKVERKKDSYLSYVVRAKKWHRVGLFSSSKQATIAAQNFLDRKGTCVRVVSVEKLDEQEHLYDFYMPKTNSFIANGFIQHNSIPREIFENTVAGFGVVSQSPMEKVKNIARKKYLKDTGIKDDLEHLEEKYISNQIVLAGTAYYEFNHFAQEWKKYKGFLDTEGNEKELNELLKGRLDKSFDWSDYSVMRIPVTSLPEGFMDESQISRARATVHSGIFQMEYGSIFTSDSMGFFKRSLIEACTVSPSNTVKMPSCGTVLFEASLKGNKDKKYIFGVDPASEIDNFSIVVLEVHGDHRRIVYCWTSTRTRHKEQLKTGLIEENDFYAYCARKIRDLMKVFPCEEIALDAGGGGIPIIEALHDKDKVKEGELPIWEVIDPDKPKDTDYNSGLHIVKMCQFSRADWLAEANHGLRKDFEDKVVLFPYFDPVTLAIAAEKDNIENRLYDTLEDCVMEIESLKDELSMIEITHTPSGREHWDTPSGKIGVGKKERLRKDRYSALLMANMSARQEKPFIPDHSYYSAGGFADGLSHYHSDPSLYIAPSWFTDPEDY